MKITVLGCGGSGGVPTVAGDWGVCDPNEPKNNRTRPSILVEDEDITLLVDTTPDMRAQLLRARPEKISAILYTHAHADHMHGFDDIRYLNLRQQKPMDIYADAVTLAEIRHRFAYAFLHKEEGKFFRPAVVCHEITGAMQFGSMTVRPFVQDHGHSESLGFRFGDFAYSTDAKNLDEAAFKALEGIKTWIVDAVRDEPHMTHSHLEQTLEWIARVKPERAYITHMNQTLDYNDLKRRLPPGVEPAYDGLEIII
ncbi:MAG: MBL fold metallo-hydrolase [Alphaproteobacteria bacterium]